MLNGILVPIHSRDVSRKKISDRVRNSGPVIYLQDGHQENTSHKSHGQSSILEITGKHMCLWNTSNFPYPRRYNFSTYGHVLSIVTQNQRVHMKSILLLPKGLIMVKVCLQVKDRKWLTLRVRFYMNLRWKMTWLICLTSQCKNKIAALCWRKRGWLSMSNKVNQNNVLL